MIPNPLALVTVNPFHHAALQAIIEVEERRRRGRYPYARALFRQLRGGKAGGISASDVRRAAELRRLTEFQRVRSAAPVCASQQYGSMA